MFGKTYMLKLNRTSTDNSLFWLQRSQPKFGSSVSSFLLFLSSFLTFQAFVVIFSFFRCLGCLGRQVAASPVPGTAGDPALRGTGAGSRAPPRHVWKSAGSAAGAGPPRGLHPHRPWALPLRSRRGADHVPAVIFILELPVVGVRSCALDLPWPVETTTGYPAPRYPTSVTPGLQC